MGAPESGMQAAEQPTAETLLTALRTIKDAERAKHESVLNYWLSIRGDKEFPPLHDLDPLEISDAGPCSILLELIGGGQDAEIRHLGDGLKDDVTVQRIIDAANPSILTCIAKKLPIVSISRDFLAFEDSFDNADGWTRCWVTLLPLSSCGSWVDYVYAFVSVETSRGKAAKPVEPKVAVEAPPESDPVEEVGAEEVEAVADVPADEPETAAPEIAEPETAADMVPFAADEPDPTPEQAVEPVAEVEASHEPEPEAPVEPIDAVEASDEPEPEESIEAPTAKGGPGFSKLIEGFANLTGFYGQGVKVDDPVVQIEPPVNEPAAIEPPASEPPSVEPEPIEPAAIETPVELEEPAPPVELVDADSEAIKQPVEDRPDEVAAEDVAPEVAPEPEPALEGVLESELSEVRAKADEVRLAQLRVTAALHEGLSAAYDFALDAEGSPEEYLRLVEAQGLKIQLRAPMAPVVKLAFDGQCDAATIKEMEAVLAWALKQELPRGALLERIEQAGGLTELLNPA